MNSVLGFDFNYHKLLFELKVNKIAYNSMIEYCLPKIVLDQLY